MYIYKITNLINSKIYIGKSELDKNENYLGSGVAIKKAIKKYGKENFSKEILCETDNIQSLNEKEKHYIGIFKEKYGRNCYNIAEGGNGGNSQKYKTDEEKYIFSEKMSKIVSGENNPFYNKSHSEESKNKISDSKIGTKMSDDFKKKRSEYMIGNNINNGRKHTDETKQKHSINNTGSRNPMFDKSHSAETLKIISQNIKESKKEKFLCTYCNKSVDKGNFNRWHDKNCKNNPNISETQLSKRTPWNKKGSTTIP